MKFKTYFEATHKHWSEVPKYLWLVNKMEDTRIVIFKYKDYGEYEQYMAKSSNYGWQDISSPMNRPYTRSEIEGMFSYHDIIDIMDDKELEAYMTLEAI